MDRILVVNVNWLGDAIMTTPAFRALKIKFPSSYIICMCIPRVKEVFESNPYINEVLLFDEKNQHKSILNKLKFIVSLRKKNIDTVFLIHRSFTRALICFFAGIKRRIGYKRFKNCFVVNHQVIQPEHLMHRKDYYLYLFENAGVVFKDKAVQFFIPDKVRSLMSGKLNNMFKEFSYIVGINPSANWALKRWPVEYFAKLSDSLAKDLNVAIIFIGTVKEKAIANMVGEFMEQRHYNFCGQTSLKELAVIMEKMSLFISNDSGPAHLAAALGINVIVIFGPTSSSMTAPQGKSVMVVEKKSNCAIPCYKLDCKDNICLKSILPEEILCTAKRILLNGQ